MILLSNGYCVFYYASKIVKIVGFVNGNMGNMVIGKYGE